MLAGTLPFTLYAGLTMFDSMLTLATVLGMTVLARPGPRAWLWLGAALAFGAYAKGPVILIHLVPAALLAPLWTGERWRAAALRLAKAVGVGLVLVGVWLVPALVTGGEEYSHAVLWTQSAGRMAASFAHERAVWFFVPLLPILLWPWIWSAACGRAAPRQPCAPTRGLRLCAVWGAATLLLFSLISGKQVHYLIPALPAAALVVARLLPAGARAPAAGVGAAASSGWRSSPSGSGSGRRRSTPRSRPTSALPSTGLLLVGLAAAGLVAARAGGGAARAGAACSLVDLAFVVGSLGRLYDARADRRGDRAARRGDRDRRRLRGRVQLRRPPAPAGDGRSPPPRPRRGSPAHPGGVLLARLDGRGIPRRSRRRSSPTTPGSSGCGRAQATRASAGSKPMVTVSPTAGGRKAAVLKVSRASRWPPTETFSRTTGPWKDTSSTRPLSDAPPGAEAERLGADREADGGAGRGRERAAEGDRLALDGRGRRWRGR